MPVDPDDPNFDDTNASMSSEEMRRMLELQLIKIRNEASAARLDARAAEIEMMMRRLRDGSSTVAEAKSSLTDSSSDAELRDRQTGHSQAGHPQVSSPHPARIRAAIPAKRFSSWGEVREAQTHSPSSHGTQLPSRTQTSIGRASDGSTPAISRSLTAEAGSANSGAGSSGSGSSGSAKPICRADSAVHQVKRPHFLDIDRPDDSDAVDPIAKVATTSDAESTKDATSDAESTKDTTSDSDAEKNTLVTPWVAADSANRPRELSAVVIDADAEAEGDEEETRRGRPAAWIFSAIAHVAVLIVLAGIGLKTHMPKDQVALSASPASASEEAIETFEIEQSEAMPETEVSEPVPSETEYELSPVGTLAATEFSPDAPPAPPTAMASSMSSAASSAASGMSMKSMSTKKMEFCGVEGGGNHFVYLVDSSGSMGDGFESARSALLQSIELLTPEQRYYVVFFDAESDYLRLADANQDEPRSVFATSENKAATKRWAMRISKDRGKAPYDPLRFALKLKPDVIFLLSDGEFPQGIEDLLEEENNVTNLFGESKPISIVHTISYYSEEGESRMRRIAKQNMGQYRYVPKP